MEMNEQGSTVEQPEDFIDMITPYLPFGDLDRALGLDDDVDMIVPTLCCSPADEQFNADDVSLFSDFVNNLWSDETDIKATVVPDEQHTDAGCGSTHPAHDTEDSDCQSQISDIIASILDHCVAVHSDKERANDKTEDNLHENVDEEQCTGSGNGCPVCNDDDDGGEITASQEWLRDQLHTHLIQQQDEASRINSLRVKLPSPPGTPAAPRDRISRAIHAFTAELEVIKLDVELTNCLSSYHSNISQCCKLLDGYSPYELSPGVLIQYPFFAGTVDVCGRWEGDDADALHTAARRLTAFMMAMYARNSIEEDFLTALNRQLAAYRRAMTANTASLSKLSKKHRELSGLSEFYRGLYSYWDTSMTQYFRSVHVDNEHTSDEMNADDRRRATSSRQFQQSNAATVMTNVADKAAESSNPAVASGAVSELFSATNADIVATGPQSEASVSAPVLSGLKADAECTSAAEDVAMTTNPWSSRLRSAMLATDTKVLDGDVKSVKESVDRGREKQAVDDDIKPAVGLPVKKKRVGRTKDSRDVISWSAVGDCGRRLRKHDMNRCDEVTAERGKGFPVKREFGVTDEDSATEDVKPVIGASGAVSELFSATNTGIVATGPQSEASLSAPVLSGLKADAECTSAAEDVAMTTNPWSSRLRSAMLATDRNVLEGDVKSVKESVDRGRKKQAVEDDIKPAVGLPVKKKRVGRTKDSRDNGTSWSAVGDCGRRLRKHDMKRCDEVTAKRGKGFPVKCEVGVTDESSATEDIKPVIGRVETRGRTSKQSKGSTGGTNSADVGDEKTWTRFEEQDVKPDLKSLDLRVRSAVGRFDEVAAKKRKGCPRKCDVSGEKAWTRKSKHSRLSASDKTTGAKNSVETDNEKTLTGFEEQDAKSKPVMGRMETRGRKSKHSALSASDTSAKNSVETDTEKTLTGFEEQDVKPDLKYLAGEMRGRSERSEPCSQSPTFTLLSPSQIKLEIDDTVLSI